MTPRIAATTIPTMICVSPSTWHNDKIQLGWTAGRRYLFAILILSFDLFFNLTTRRHSVQTLVMHQSNSCRTSWESWNMQFGLLKVSLELNEMNCDVHVLSFLSEYCVALFWNNASVSPFSFNFATVPFCIPSTRVERSQNQGKFLLSTNEGF